jgi:hypothetical protein
MSLSFCVQKIEPTDVGFTYHGFNEFRHRIARSIGLKDVYSLTETDMYHTGRYKEIETTHPMYPLIDHDDAEGDMGPDDCGQVGKYLKIIILEWRKELEDNFSAELKNDIDMAERLSEVMMQCYQHGETLLFM